MDEDNYLNQSFDTSFNDEEISDNTSTEGSDLDSEFMDIENGSIHDNQTNDLTAEDWEAFDLMLSYSFSNVITSNSHILEALKETYTKFSEFTYQNQDNLDEIRLKAIINIASAAYGSNIDKINRSREERLCFEAVCLLLFSRRDYLSHDFLFSEEEFMEYYPEYSPSATSQLEFIALFKFRNLMKLAMHVIPPLHNKNHLLDLVTRLVEGKDVRHVTGTGATKATKARVGIILKEGNLVVPRRPPRLTYASNAQKHKKTTSHPRRKSKNRHTSSSSGSHSSSDMKRKRGRPRKDSVTSDDISHTLPRLNSTSSSMVDPFNLHPMSKKPRTGSGSDLSPSNSVDSQLMAVIKSSDSFALSGHHSQASQSYGQYVNSSNNNMNDQVGFDYCNPSLYDCELPLPPDLMRCQSIEWWAQSLAGGSETFKPELLRETSFFHGINADGAISFSNHHL